MIGLGHGPAVLLGVGGTLIYAAVLLYVWVIGNTLRAAPTRDTTWWHVTAATTALATGASLGLFLRSANTSGSWLG